MKRDPYEAAIDKILATADGDVRRALRAVLEKNVELETELRHLYAASEHGRRADSKQSLH
jgi:Arc/MetJ-type ribon-helix-helix transcriptional regulator